MPPRHPNFGNDQNESKMTEFNVVGINCYEGLGVEGNLIARHRAMNGDGRKVKPLLVTEWGCPYSSGQSGHVAELPASKLPDLENFLKTEYRAMANKSRRLCWRLLLRMVRRVLETARNAILDQSGEGQAESAIPGGYWDEKWFGIMAVEVSGGRLPKDPVNTRTGDLYPIDKHTARPHFQYIADLFKL